MDGRNYASFMHLAELHGSVRRLAVCNTSLYYIRKVSGRNFPSMATFSKNSLKLNGAAAFGAEFPHQDSAVPAGLIMAGPAPPTLKRGAIFVCPLRDSSVIQERPTKSGLWTRRAPNGLRECLIDGLPFRLNLYKVGGSLDGCATNQGDITSPYLYMEARIEIGPCF